jgi:DNA-binding Lrp family transcriptional regulator
MSAATTGDDVGGEDEDINEAVESMARRPSVSMPPRPEALLPSPQTVAGNPSEEFNPRDRLSQVRRRATEYEKEYRLGLLHRLMMRRIPIDEIADQLGISVSQVYRDREELKRRLRSDARGLDIEEIIGDSKGYYDEAAAMAMRAASNSNIPMPMRLAAIRTALAAKNDMHRFFQTAGVYDVLRFRLAQDGTGMSDVKRLMENTERLLQGDALEFSNATQEVIDSGSHEELEL